MASTTMKVKDIMWPAVETFLNVRDLIKTFADIPPQQFCDMKPSQVRIAALNAIATTAGPTCKEAVAGALRIAENGRDDEVQAAIISNLEKVYRDHVNIRTFEAMFKLPKDDPSSLHHRSVESLSAWARRVTPSWLDVYDTFTQKPALTAVDLVGHLHETTPDHVTRQDDDPAVPGDAGDHGQARIDGDRQVPPHSPRMLRGRVGRSCDKRPVRDNRQHPEESQHPGRFRGQRRHDGRVCGEGPAGATRQGSLQRTVLRMHGHTEQPHERPVLGTASRVETRVRTGPTQVPLAATTTWPLAANTTAITYSAASTVAVTIASAPSPYPTEGSSRFSTCRHDCQCARESAERRSSY